MPVETVLLLVGPPVALLAITLLAYFRRERPAA
jgi:hypothetical protein